MNAVALLVIVAATAVVYPTEQEQAEALAPFQKCLNEQAARLEDGHTDIAVLGKAVADACRPQFEDMVASMSKSLSPEDRVKLRESLEGMEVGAGAVAIAQIRYKIHPPNP